MNYFAVAGMCLTAAAVLALAVHAFKFQCDSAKGFKLILIFAAAVFSVYSGIMVYKYYTMYLGLWDFGIYDSLLHNTASGKGFMRDYRGPFDHFSPAALILVPLYWLFDNPLVLIFFQSAVMAAAAVPLYLLAGRYFRKPAMPLLLTAMYLLNPYYSRMALYDFHIECLFPLVFFSAWLAFACRRMRMFTLILICVPLIKEDLLIPLAASGLFLCSRRKTMLYGIICLAAALLWSLFVLKVWFPVTLGTQYQHYGRFPPLLGCDFMDTVNNLRLIAGQCFSQNSMAVLCSVLLPFAFLPVFSPRSFLLLLCPVLFIQFCTIFLHQQLLMSHYSSAVIAVTPLAAIFGARFLRVSVRKWRLPVRLRKYSFRFSACLLVVAHVAFCDLPFVSYHEYVKQYKPGFQFGVLSVPLYNYRFLFFDHAVLFHDLRANIPAGVSITAQNNLGYFFVRSNPLYRMPGPDNSGIFLFDGKTSVGFDQECMERRFDWLLKNPDYILLLKQDGIFMFCRKNLAVKP